MKFFKYMKDGGPESKVFGFFFAEIKSLFSVVLLHFFDGTREAYHDHAFNAISWVLKGKLIENVKRNLGMALFPTASVSWFEEYTPSLLPIWTPRDRMHNVESTGDTWVLSFRGPWVDRWHEFIPKTQQNLTLTHGRQVVDEDN
jgi:hypothetical protein